MVDGEKITGIISENTNTFVWPKRKRRQYSQPEGGIFMQKLEREIYLYYHIYQYIPKTLREVLNRWFPGLIREPIPVRVRSERRVDTHRG